MIAFVFPGQGSQYVGMGKELYDQFPSAKETFDEASEVLGFDLAALCFEGEQEELSLTFNAQPALLTTSIASLRVLEDEVGTKSDFVAGHSLGEYSALVANGSMKLGDAVMTVRKRGEFMQEAVPVGVGAMAAILGKDIDEVSDICSQVSKNSHIASPANLNAPGQVVISGNKEAVEEASEIAKSQGAKRVVPLDVSAPFHCALMEPAAERLSEVLSTVEFSAMSAPVISNCTAAVTDDPALLRDLLIQQVTSPVRWSESVQTLHGLGVKDYIEVGPKNVLAGLIKRTLSDINVKNFEKTAHLESMRND